MGNLARGLIVLILGLASTACASTGDNANDGNIIASIAKHTTQFFGGDWYEVYSPRDTKYTTITTGTATTEKVDCSWEGNFLYDEKALFGDNLEVNVLPTKTCMNFAFQNFSEYVSYMLEVEYNGQKFKREILPGENVIKQFKFGTGKAKYGYTSLEYVYNMPEVKMGSFTFKAVEGVNYFKYKNLMKNKRTYEFKFFKVVPPKTLLGEVKNEFITDAVLLHKEEIDWTVYDDKYEIDVHYRML